jgi:hypothetical protein
LMRVIHEAQRMADVTRGPLRQHAPMRAVSCL